MVANRKSFHKPRRRLQPSPDEGAFWLHGRHAVGAALANPNRTVLEFVATKEALDSLPDPRGRRPGLNIRLLDRAQIGAMLPAGAVHQGLALRVTPLPPIELERVLGEREAPRRTIVVLDHVTDPHNVGAVLRSAAAFGALAVVVTERVSARAEGTLAKAASGALDHVPLVAVVNLARALEQLKTAGFWCLGLDSEAERDLDEGLPGLSIALVLGAEGEGLRRLTRERCDLIVRLPTRAGFPSLNVSNAAAVALYAVATSRAD
jgi:23S rRNA (guanosine2251-2'-O)-methyltransferase